MGQLNKWNTGRRIVLIETLFSHYIVMTIIKFKEQRNFIYNIEIILYLLHCPPVADKTSCRDREELMALNSWIKLIQNIICFLICLKWKNPRCFFHIDFWGLFFKKINIFFLKSYGSFF